MGRIWQNVTNIQGRYVEVQGTSPEMLQGFPDAPPEPANWACVDLETNQKEKVVKGASQMEGAGCLRHAVLSNAYISCTWKKTNKQNNNYDAQKIHHMQPPLHHFWRQLDSAAISRRCLFQRNNPTPRHASHMFFWCCAEEGTRSSRKAQLEVH